VALFGFVGVVLLVVTLPSSVRANFWEDFDQKYGEKVAQDMELYIQHKKEMYATDFAFF
jgi:hypothetical protein